MNRKALFIMGSLFISAALIALTFSFVPRARGAETLDWPGVWQAGPDLNTAMLGCSASDGFARFTGVYYPDNDRVYFLGGRCENNSTSGAVFYFNLATRTYATAGVTMPTPVSNYQVVLVNNDGRGHGPGLYIVGGRTGTGGQTSAVQVYYPQDNTVATIATDPYPASPANSPGGVVVVNEKIYVFGGFDGTNMSSTTYIYDPLAPAGSRWTTTACNLPSARSYIAVATIGDLIYAIGGDEFAGGSLIPLNDTVVLDTANLGACWQDSAMADLPSADGDATATYVPDGFLGGTAGGIYVVGGFWPSPGPYRWVFRYDVASDTWENFPELSIPAPATGRRNLAVTYIPPAARNAGGEPQGIGTGVPGIWAFGGYDGSGTNAMTASSEFFSIESGPVLVLPLQLEVIGAAGMTVDHDFILVNQSGAEDTYDLAYTSDVTWTVSLPASLGPVADGAQEPFTMLVSVPPDVACPVSAVFTVTATSQANPVDSDSQAVSVRTACGVVGTVTDSNTAEPIENAYVWVQNTVDGLDYYRDAYTDADGVYLISDLPAGDYFMGISAGGFQPSFYPSGWPAGAITFTMVDNSIIEDFAMVGSQIGALPASLEATINPGEVTTQSLTISNSGTGPLYYTISVLDGAMVNPPAGEAAVPGLGRVDDKIFQDIAASPDGTADFIVIVDGQADLSAAYTITDWSARGHYVYNSLKEFSDQYQVGVRQLLARQGFDYTPLYIVNGLLVRGGTANLVNSLAARPDVLQIVGNHQIAVEDTQPVGLERLLQPVEAPTAIEWNILKVKADQVWNTFGVRGEGAVVAEIDTGTQWDHPALKSHYRGWDGSTANHNYNWFDPYKQCAPEGRIPCDPGAHGTHVMGTMVGDDGGPNQIGVAPGARWISCKGGDAVSGYLLTNELLQCAEWILAPFDLNGNNPNPDMRPHAVNNSWGGGNADYWFTGAVSSWRAAGIFPAFSNGNSGPACSTAGSPGDNWNTFSSGASDINDAIAGFSSRGPSLYYGIGKPNITSPGVNIRSSVPGSTYQSGWSGTSMASPHTAAAVALIWSAALELIGQIDTTAWLLESTALTITTTETCGGDTPASHPNNTYGWGRLDTYNAVATALAGGVMADWLDVKPLSGLVPAGGSATVDLTFTAPALTGTYTATLWLTADDPYNRDFRINVTMNSITLPALEVTFEYHDLEDLLDTTDTLWLIGDFTDWQNHPITLTANASASLFSTTLQLPPGTYAYKYFVASLPYFQNWDMLNTSNRSASISAPTSLADFRNVSVGWAHLADPVAVTITLGSDSGPLVGEVYISNVTNGPGQGPGLRAQLGYGTASDPASWTWMDMTYSGENGNNDLYQAALAPAAVGAYHFGVRFDGNTGPGNPNAGWSLGDRTGLLTVLPSADLEVSLSDDPDPVQVGGLLTYTLTVSNHGPSDATSVVLTDTLPAGVSFVSADPACSEDSGLVTCALGDLVSGASQTLHIVVSAPATAGELFNSAEVAGAEADPDLANNTASATTTVEAHTIFMPVILRH
jgi:uncharacterized repeat protein (TIGR01451 family)